MKQLIQPMTMSRTGKNAILSADSAPSPGIIKILYVEPVESSPETINEDTRMQAVEFEVWVIKI